jgi:hypothetical protein
MELFASITLAINEVTEALPKIGRLSTAYESVVIGGEEDLSHASGWCQRYPQFFREK